MQTCVQSHISVNVALLVHMDMLLSMLLEIESLQ